MGKVAPAAPGVLDCGIQPEGKFRVLPVSLFATGAYLPPPEPTARIDQAQGWPPGTVERHCGVASRPRAGAADTASSMAAAAIAQAVGPDLSMLDRLVVASTLPEQPIPTTAALAARHLGLSQPLCAHDVNGSCLGFLQALEGAALAIVAGRATQVAVAAVELATQGLDPADRDTAGLFGDGAGAVLLGPGQDGAGILALELVTLPVGIGLCALPAGGSRFNLHHPPADDADRYFRMDGMGLARLAMEELPGFVDGVLAKAGVTMADIACIIPHQASRLGLRFLRRWLGEEGPPMVDILADHGNQVSASLPIALHHAVTNGQLRRGQLGLMVGTAAGFGMGAMVFRY